MVRELLLQEVFNSLHIVIGGALDRLDRLGVRDREVVNQGFQQRMRRL